MEYFLTFCAGCVVGALALQYRQEIKSKALEVFAKAKARFDRD